MEAFERLLLKAQEIINSLEEWAERSRRHSIYVTEVVQSTPTYTPEAVDMELAEELKQALKGIVDGDLAAHMQKMTAEERVQFIEQTILPLVASKMSINYNKLEWLEEESRLCGYYNRTREVIALNMAYVASNDYKLLTILLNTIIHECKHARQWAAVEGADFGYSQELINKWKRNIEDYISPRESDEGYVKQPLEFDATEFANSIIDERIIFEK